MIRYVALLLCLLSTPGEAQDALSASDFRSRVVENALHGAVGWHLDNVNPDAPGPLVVWLPGSGAIPYFSSFADGSIGYAFPPELFKYRNEAHFLLVEKPGVPLSAKLDFDEERQRPIELDNDVYRIGLTKDNLVARAVIAIDAARSELGERATQIVIIGGSEGGQYAFALAREVQPDRVIAWGGIALPQYYDLVLELRLQAERGEITRAEAQRQIEGIYSTIRAIEEKPLDTSERFYGEAYRRWSSFGPYSAIDDMLSLEVPLLLIQGGADRNAPIFNSDYAMVAFLSQGKTNLDYWVYPNLDHFFRDVMVEPALPEADRSKEVWDRAWRWMAADE